MGFSRQQYGSGMPYPRPGGLPDPGIEPRSPASQADPSLTEPAGKPFAVEARMFLPPFLSLDWPLPQGPPWAFPSPFPGWLLSSEISPSDSGADPPLPVVSLQKSGQSRVEAALRRVDFWEWGSRWRGSEWITSQPQRRRSEVLTSSGSKRLFLVSDLPLWTLAWKRRLTVHVCYLRNRSLMWYFYLSKKGENWERWELGSQLRWNIPHPTSDWNVQLRSWLVVWVVDPADPNILFPASICLPRCGQAVKRAFQTKWAQHILTGCPPGLPEVFSLGCGFIYNVMGLGGRRKEKMVSRKPNMVT